MSKEPESLGSQAPAVPLSEAERRELDRKQRAAAKLRENLMRRKSQSRARRAGEADETQGLPASSPSAAKTDESS